MRREPRQPPVFHLDLPGGPLDARESHGHVVAEPIDGVVRSRGGDSLDGKIRPIRKLCREQSAHEGCVGGYLVRVH